MKNMIIATALATLMLAVSTKGFAQDTTVEDDLKTVYKAYYSIKVCANEDPYGTYTPQEAADEARTAVIAISDVLTRKKDMDANAIWDQAVSEKSEFSASRFISEMDYRVHMASIISDNFSGGSYSPRMDVDVSCIGVFGDQIMDIAEKYNMLAVTGPKATEKDF